MNGGSQIQHLFLNKFTCDVKKAWIDEHISLIKSCKGNIAGDDLNNLLLNIFLSSDISTSVLRSGVPSNIRDLHAQVLTGPFILQVLEVHNIGESFEKRNQETPKRCLKLFMTDGCQQVLGIEYQSIPELKIDLPPGYKVIIANVTVRRGVLLLTADNVQFLGGQVASLVQAWKETRGIKTEDGEEPTQEPLGADMEDNEYGMPVESTNKIVNRNVQPQSQPHQQRITPPEAPPQFVAQSRLRPPPQAKAESSLLTDVEELTSNFYNLSQSPIHESSWLGEKRGTERVNRMVTDADIEMMHAETLFRDRDDFDSEAMDVLLAMEEEERAEHKGVPVQPVAASKSSQRPEVTVRSKKRGQGVQPNEMNKSRSEYEDIYLPQYKKSTELRQPLDQENEMDALPLHISIRSQVQEGCTLPTDSSQSISSMNDMDGEENFMNSSSGNADGETRPAKVVRISSFLELGQCKGKTASIQAEFVRQESFKIRNGRYVLVVHLKDMQNNLTSVRISNELMQDDIFGLPAIALEELLSSSDPEMNAKAAEYAMEAQAKLASLGMREVRIQVPAAYQDNSSSSTKKIPVVLSL